MMIPLPTGHALYNRADELHTLTTCAAGFCSRQPQTPHSTKENLHPLEALFGALNSIIAATPQSQPGVTTACEAQ